MFEKETDEVEPGVIIEVMQPGWSLHDRLLRPAMVGVSKKKPIKIKSCILFNSIIKNYNYKYLYISSTLPI